MTNSISGLSDFEELVEVIQRRLRWDVSGGCLTCEELVGVTHTRITIQTKRFSYQVVFNIM